MISGIIDVFIANYYSEISYRFQNFSLVIPLWMLKTNKMKNLIYILFTLFTMGMVTTTLAQTCQLELKDILAIDSQDSFERVLIENNFQKINTKGEWKKEIGNISMKDTLLLLYGYKGTRKNSYSTEIIRAFGYFPIVSEIDSGNNFNLMFTLSNPKNENSVYNIIFSEVKEKCSFDKVYHSDDGGSAAFYNCPNATFKGKIGFSIDDDNGFIMIKPADPLKELDSLMDDFKDYNSKVTADPNASGYYGNGSGSGGNYRLGNRKALTKPIPNYDCNEEGMVFVSISVDNSGNVIWAIPGVKGTTNSAACLLQRAKEAALKTKFNSDTDAPAKQVGTIIYNFSLSK